MLAPGGAPAAACAALPIVDSRWTRSCFCGRKVDGHAVADSPVMGLPFLTGSEENRGPLFDVDGVEHEGDRLPGRQRAAGQQDPGDRQARRRLPDRDPARGLAASATARWSTVPGEMTAEMGRRTRAAALDALRGAGVRQVALAGYANEYVHYFTTPEEYEQQHYEGGSTLYGRYSATSCKATSSRSRERSPPRPGPEPVRLRPAQRPGGRRHPVPDRAESGAVRRAARADAARLTRARFAGRAASAASTGRSTGRS